MKFICENMPLPTKILERGRALARGLLKINFVVRATVFDYRPIAVNGL